jgi:hypothetical protein
MNKPDKMKKGIANKAKLSIPVAMLWAVAVNAGTLPMATNASTAAIPMQNATGTFNSIRTRKLTTNTVVGVSNSMLLQERQTGEGF